MTNTFYVGPLTRSQKCKTDKIVEMLHKELRKSRGYQMKFEQPLTEIPLPRGAVEYMGGSETIITFTIRH